MNDQIMGIASRRRFIEGAAVSAAAFAGAGFLNGGTLRSACAEQAEEKPWTLPAFSETVDETLECDAVVAGSGISGMAAALTGAEGGAKVILFE